ncbi:AraC family transcriptional regulator [Actinoplanes sp. NPDC048791]|uniref:AraC family transcriptional regulator n=1 Tax=Actinoplanes sp. NPDC048791 TaxID=3154623 RepID=UPI003408F187
MFDWSYCPLTVQPRSAVDAFSFDLTVVQLGPLTVGDLAYGVDVSTGLGYMDAYQLNLPLAGHVQARQHGAEAAAGPGWATLFRPSGGVDQPLISGGCRQIATKIDAVALESTLAELLGHPVQGPLHIPLGNDFTTGPGRSLVRMLRLIHAELDNDNGLLHQPLIASRLWSCVLTGVLLATDHQYRAELAGSVTPSRPRHVKLAIDSMEADPGRAVTINDLARTAGVSVRSLQEGFHRHTGMSPMTYLRRLRLAKAHEDLLRPDSGGRTVTEIAYRWGFLHLGRFAAAYRAQYGHSPSQTLRMKD